MSDSTDPGGDAPATRRASSPRDAAGAAAAFFLVRLVAGMSAKAGRHRRWTPAIERRGAVTCERSGRARQSVFSFKGRDATFISTANFPPPVPMPARALVALIASLSTPAVDAVAKTRGITSQDYFAFELVSDPR